MACFRIAAVASLVLFPMLPGHAAAAELAEFSWNASHHGPGSILYWRDLPGAVPNEDGGATFADSIHSFKISALYQELDPYQFDGVGGSVRTWNGPCALDPSPSCTAAHITFQLGTMANGDPGPWQVDITLPSNVQLLPDGRAPFDNQPGGWSGMSAYVTNTQDGTAYLTMDMRNRVFHRVFAAPVPEPGAALLAALGVVAVLARTGRRRTASARGA